MILSYDNIKSWELNQHTNVIWKQHNGHFETRNTEVLRCIQYAVSIVPISYIKTYACEEIYLKI